MTQEANSGFKNAVQVVQNITKITLEPSESLGGTREMLIAVSEHQAWLNPSLWKNIKYPRPLVEGLSMHPAAARSIFQGREDMETWVEEYAKDFDVKYKKRKGLN